MSSQTASGGAYPCNSAGETSHRTAAPAPLCTSCAYPAPYVYTTYTSRSNIRLAVCTQCGAFVDPLIEAPPLLLALDLVLLKPRVFLHLLYNRGSPPFDARGVVTSTSALSSSIKSGYDRSARLWADLLRLAAATLVAEVAVRLLVVSSGNLAPWVVVSTAVRAGLELAAQLGTSTLLAMAILRLKGWYPPPSQLSRDKANAPSYIQAVPAIRDGRRDGFLPTLVPLVLLYTALLPLVLRLVLRIWYPTTAYQSPSSSGGGGFTLALERYVPVFAAEVAALAEQWGSTDRVWAGTRLLGGMSAGFGLRVLLPTRPWETVAIVLAGWSAGLGASRVCELVGI